MSTLSGCGSAKETIPESLFEAVDLMTSTKNYTLNQIADGDVIKRYVVSERAIGCYDKHNLDSMDIYLVSGKGMYNVRFEDTYRKSEYILDSEGKYITDLWDNEIINTLYGIDANEVVFDKGAKELTIKNRDFKLGFLGLVGMASTSYADVEYIKASFEGTLNFEVKFFDKKMVYNYEATNFGSSTIDYAEKQIRQKSGAFTPDEDLANMRALIRGSNFKINSYDVIEETFYAQEWLNPNYWLTTNGTYGYVAMNHDGDPTNAEDNDVKGCFMFQIQDGKLGFFPNPLSDVTDIAEFMNYPSRMSTLNNMQYINKGDYELKSDYKYNGEVYYVTNKTYVYDILNAFSLNPSKSPDGSIFQVAEPKAIVMDIDIDPLYEIGDDSSKDTTITYIYVFEYNHDTYEMYLPMVDFGGVSIPSLDKYLETFNNAK